MHCIYTIRYQCTYEVTVTFVIYFKSRKTLVIYIARSQFQYLPRNTKRTWATHVFVALPVCLLIFVVVVVCFSFSCLLLLCATVMVSYTHVSFRICQSCSFSLRSHFNNHFFFLFVIILGMHFSQAVAIIQSQVGVIKGVQVLYSETVVCTQKLLN